MPDTPHMLDRAGRWDQALALLSPEETALRAELLVNRFWWRLQGGAEAEAAVDALPPEVTAGYLRAQIAYTRLLFGLEPRPDDVRTARRGFERAAGGDGLAGWGRFWLGVLADNIDEDRRTAGEHYAAAAGHAHDDPLLRSYVLRHQAAHLLKSDHATAVTLLRRSYVLRAALGARPQTAAAAATLAAALPPGEESRDLRESALLTAEDLKLTWLLDHLR
ncbi:hypothetical protein Psi01_28890 [Planobispora siamensis]|uniref:Uncharacterized protein n=2 Tax=Planobispora siamensis TaxID=936338 RepID=A0A8J3SHK6_9ACTN|nr:hypothetical protein Psi01_28890 [Planobispora siamensis]